MLAISIGPDIDIDLAIESIEHPERFPLVAKLH